MEPEEIEFVADGDAPPPPTAPIGPRVLRGLLAAAVLAGGLAFALSRHSGPTAPAAAPSPTSPLIAAPLTLSVGPSVNVACMATAGCNVSAADVTGIEQAVTAHLPHAVLSAINTSVMYDHGVGNLGLKQRIIEAHLDSVDVLVRIRPYLKPEPAPTVGITPTPPGLGSAFFRFTTASFVVDIQWTGTDANPPPVDNLEALASDPRLEALG